MREGPGGLEARHTRNRRMRSNIEEYPVGCEYTRPAVIQFHLEGLRRHKTSATHDQLSTACLVDLQMLRHLALHHLAFALTNLRHIDGDRTAHCATLRAVTRDMHCSRAGDLVLGGHTSDVGTGAANPASLHNGGSSSRLRHVPGDELAPRTAAKDQDLILLRLNHVFSPDALTPKGIEEKCGE